MKNQVVLDAAGDSKPRSSAKRPTLGTRTREAVLVLACLLGAATVAHAAPFTVSDSLPQTVDGQDFDFAFSGVPLSDGSDGILTIHARGDYQAANATEFLTWDLDFLGIGSLAGPLTGSATILLDNGVNDVEWTQTFTILGSDLVAATSDGVVHALLDLNLDALFLGVNHLADTEFAGVTLSYESVNVIPEPSGALLFAAGFLAIGGRRRRRTRSG